MQNGPACQENIYTNSLEIIILKVVITGGGKVIHFVSEPRVSLKTPGGFTRPPGVSN
jgi:hypothetical protein